MYIVFFLGGWLVPQIRALPDITSGPEVAGSRRTVRTPEIFLPGRRKGLLKIEKTIKICLKFFQKIFFKFFFQIFFQDFFCLFIRFRSL
jgi:hypothetical protein